MKKIAVLIGILVVAAGIYTVFIGVAYHISSLWHPTEKDQIGPIVPPTEVISEDEMGVLEVTPLVNTDPYYRLGEVARYRVEVPGGNPPYTVNFRGMMSDWVSMRLEEDGDLTELGRIGESITAHTEKTPEGVAIIFSQPQSGLTRGEGSNMAFGLAEDNGKVEPRSLEMLPVVVRPPL
jgi:hypothetical protein